MDEVEAQNILKASEMPFGDRLDRLVVALAEAASPLDNPWSRLQGTIALMMPKARGNPNRMDSIAATVSCISGTKEDVRWVLGVLGVPTDAIPGQMMFWRFNKPLPTTPAG